MPCPRWISFFGLLHLTRHGDSTIMRSFLRGVAQSGSALEWGSSGPRFKSARPDLGPLGSHCSEPSGPFCMGRFLGPPPQPNAPGLPRALLCPLCAPGTYSALPGRDRACKSALLILLVERRRHLHATGSVGAHEPGDGQDLPAPGICGRGKGTQQGMAGGCLAVVEGTRRRTASPDQVGSWRNRCHGTWRRHRRQGLARSRCLAYARIRPRIGVRVCRTLTVAHPIAESRSRRSAAEASRDRH